jgi:hypothetical protein
MSVPLLAGVTVIEEVAKSAFVDIHPTILRLGVGCAVHVAE